MKLHLPTYLGDYEVELSYPLADDDEVVGWVDEYGTITSSKINQRIGDLIPTENSEWCVLVMRKDW